MKTKIYTLAAILTFQVSILFGANEMNNVTPVKDMNKTMNVILSPVTPSEADFSSDILPEPAPKALSLAPNAPRFADFEESVAESTAPSISLAPETPAEADFSEEVEVQNVSLEPETPVSADFE